MEVFFPVIVGGVIQSLLGEDFIRHFKCNFDHEGRTFIISKGGMSYDKNSIKSSCKRLARVILADSIEIPPGCEIVVPAPFKDKPINSDGILVPDTVLTLKHGLLLARSVVTSEQSSFCARVLNPGKDTVCIQKGTVLGLCEPVSDVKQCNINRTTQEPVLHVADVNSQEELPSYPQDIYTDGSQNLSPTQQVEFRKILMENQSVFARPGEVGRTHKIQLRTFTCSMAAIFECYTNWVNKSKYTTLQTKSV